MIENNIDNVKNRIEDITLKIDFHENRIAMHRSVIKSYEMKELLFQSVR